MIKKCFVIFLIFILLPYHVLAANISEQEYVNRLKYQREKLELVTKQRQIDEERKYRYTDIDTTTYSYEAFTQTYTDITTQALRRKEIKEITDWYIFKGGIRELSDVEFLALIGDKARLDRVIEIENQKAGMRTIGNILIGAGLLAMIGGAAFSAPEGTTTAGALGMTAGFFVSAFNLSPAHYIEPDYAQEKIDEYNVNLKKELGLPLEFN